MARPRKPPLGRVRDATLTRLEYMRRAGHGAAERRVVAIVGMHRSGTSAVSGTLQEAGLYLGNVLRKHESNRRGTREHLGIVALHDEILSYSGGSWRAPPAVLRWTDEHRASRDGLIASFGAAELWGFKDPRAILLLDFWREALGDSLQLAGVFRDPASVVSSLLARDGGAADEWFALWDIYNTALLREHAAAPFSLVEFRSDPRRFHDELAPVVAELGLAVPRRAHFFDSRLPSAEERSLGGCVPASSADIYERLLAAKRS